MVGTGGVLLANFGSATSPAVRLAFCRKDVTVTVTVSVWGARVGSTKVSVEVTVVTISLVLVPPTDVTVLTMVLVAKTVVVVFPGPGAVLYLVSYLLASKKAKLTVVGSSSQFHRCSRRQDSRIRRRPHSLCST
jgi:hypothetical protein